MRVFSGRDPRVLAFRLAGAAVVLGCLLLALGGAPMRMILINLAALAIALVLLQFARRVAQLGRRSAMFDALLVGLSAIVPLTAIAGPEMDGVSRWLVVGGVTLQPSLIVAPLVAVAFAIRPSLFIAIAIGEVALGVAMQPDPGSAAMLFMGLAAADLTRSRAAPRALQATTLAASAAALVWSLLHAGALPPVPFVENVLADALAGGAVSASLCGAALVAFFLPAVALRRNRAASLAFAGAWLGAFVMAAVGPYPTPVVGFGGSAVLGYVLSLGVAAAQSRSNSALAVNVPDDRKSDDPGLRFAGLTH